MYGTHSRVHVYVRVVKESRYVPERCRGNERHGSCGGDEYTMSEMFTTKHTHTHPEISSPGNAFKQEKCNSFKH